MTRTDVESGAHTHNTTRMTNEQTHTPLDAHETQHHIPSVKVAHASHPHRELPSPHASRSLKLPPPRQAPGRPQRPGGRSGATNQAAPRVAQARPPVRASLGLCGEAAKDDGREAFELTIEARNGTDRRRARRTAVARQRRATAQRRAMQDVLAGREADDRERWLVRELVAVWRPLPRRGRQLEVLTAWEGQSKEGQPSPEVWLDVTQVSPDLKREARRMKRDKYPPGASAGPEQRQSARADRREAARLRRICERDRQRWAARLRDRQPDGRAKRGRRA